MYCHNLQSLKNNSLRNQKSLLKLSVIKDCWDPDFTPGELSWRPRTCSSPPLVRCFNPVSAAGRNSRAAPVTVKTSRAVAPVSRGRELRMAGRHDRRSQTFTLKRELVVEL